METVFTSETLKRTYEFEEYRYSADNNTIILGPENLQCMH
jgi:hypothetical protein